MFIECRNIIKQYNGKVVLDIEHLKLGKNKIIGIVGANGAGKSTLLHIIAGLNSEHQGTVKYYNDLDLAKDATLVFQSPYLLRGSVTKNIAYPLKIRKVQKQVQGERIKEILQLLNLGELAGQSARTLSGGEKQRTAIARALVFQPRLILLDEPTASIDPKSTKLIEEVLLEQVKKEVTIIIITHNLAQANRICDEVVFLKDGKCAEHVVSKNPLRNCKTDVFAKYIADEIL